MDIFSLQAVPSCEWTTALTNIPPTEHLEVDAFFVTCREIAAHKARDEGMRLWIDEYVRSMKFRLEENRCLVSARVRPSMRSSSPYVTSLYLTRTGCIESAYCNCKAGAGGLCKHVAATWYHLWGLQKKNVAEVPRDKAPTEVPAYWLSRMQPGSEGLPFRNIVVTKHREVSLGMDDESAMGLLNPSRPCWKDCYEPLPRPEDRVLTTATLQQLVDGLEEIGQGGMVVDGIESNDYRPSHNPSVLVQLDHGDYARQIVSVNEEAASCSSATGIPPARVKLPSTDLSPDPGMAWSTFLSTLLHGEASPAITDLPPVTSRTPAEQHIVQLSPEQLALLREKGVCVSENGAKRLENGTRTQSSNPLWHSLRRVRLTASDFGMVCKRTAEKYPTSILKTVLGKSSANTKVMNGSSGL